MLNFNTNNYNAGLNTSNTQNATNPTNNSGTNTAFTGGCAFGANQQMMSILLNLIQLIVQNLMNNAAQQNPNTGTGTMGTGTTGTGTTGTGTTGTGTTGTGTTGTGTTGTGTTGTGTTGTGTTGTGTTGTGTTGTGTTGTGTTGTGTTGTGTNVCGNGKIWGDPHFVDADGGNYDVQGYADKTYNILSDHGIQVNAEFKKFGNETATVMGKVGITMGHDQVEIDDSGELLINGQTKNDGTYTVDGNIVKKQGNDVSVQTSEYKIDANIKKGSNIDLGFSSSNVMSDGVDPHGLWGQTVDGDGIARNGDTGSGAQGGGAIEKLDGTISAKGDKTTVNLYEVGGLFDTQFTNFNQFGK